MIIKCDNCDEEIKICKNCKERFEVGDEIVCLHKKKYPGHIHSKCLDLFFEYDIGFYAKAVLDGIIFYKGSK